MRHRPEFTFSLAALLLTLSLVSGWLLAQPAAAQSPDASLISYGQTATGEVTSASGTEHFFTGCVGEAASIQVVADDFAPRVEVYYADEADPIAGMVAPTSATSNNSATEREIVIAPLMLPGNGRYTIVVSGRSRSDRGTYSVTLEGTRSNGSALDDGDAGLDLSFDEVVTGSVRAGRVHEWSFRGCEGDMIHAQLAADDFAPELNLYTLTGESPLASATADDENGDGVTVELRYTLPQSGVYVLTAGGAGRTDAGDYSLGLYFEGTEEVTVISEFTPTPTPTAADTPSGGPRVRRGTPTPKAPPQRATPTPTPEFEMPGFGEGSFTVFDIAAVDGPISHAAYVPDSDDFATAGENGSVHIWDGYTGTLVQTMTGHEARANYVAFAPAADLLASAGDDGMVRLWDPATAEEIATLEMPDNGVTSVAFSPSSKELVATTDGGDVVVWNVADGRVLHELPGHEGPVYQAAYSPDGAQIATGDGAGVVRIWDAADGTLLDTLPVNCGPGSCDPILSVAFSNDGSSIVVGGVAGVNPGTVQIWDLTTGDRLGDLVGHQEWGSTAVVRADDAYIVSAGRAEPGQDGPAPATVRIWDTNGDLRIALVGYPSSVVAAIFRPDGAELLTSDGTTVYLWPGPMIDVFAATYGEPVGVQVPVPSAETPAATPTPTATTRATPTSTPTRIPTATPTSESSTVELDIFCTVTTDRLNLRAGPGTNFDPPLAVLESGEIVVGIGRNADSTWLQVVVLDENLEPEITGWVSVDFLFCVGDIESAPVVQVES